MNSIKAEIHKSEYEIYGDYMNFKIDESWFDEKVDQLHPGNLYKGLVPTLLFWMEIENERKLVWERILPKENQKSICPILMCPDDCDFSCTLILVEIENCGNLIKWNQLGINQSIESDPEKVGSMVAWLDKFEPMKFEIAEYLKMLEDFKTQFKFDKLKWEELNKEIEEDMKN